VKYKETGFGKSAVYGSKDRKMLVITGLLLINYIFACQKNYRRNRETDFQ
jgi:hypothetical protein